MQSKNINFKLYGYCIMDNHYHLLIKTDSDYYSEKLLMVSKIMHSINTSYANYYNRMNGRIGHAFNERFSSREVLDEKYLMNTIKYIHNNPVEAQIVNVPVEYFFSSCRYYLNKKQKIIDTDFILNHYNENIDKAIELFKNDMNNYIEDEYYLELNEEKKIKRIYKIDEAVIIIKNKLQSWQITKNELLSEKNKIKEITKLLKKGYMTNREIDISIKKAFL